MQVSWIDADEVRDLVAVLAEPPARTDAGTPDLETLPETGDRYGFAFVTENVVPFSPLAVPAPAAPTFAAPAAATTDAEAPIQPDVSLIRERLRAIRDRAQEAGLLPKETPAERAARAAAASAPSPSPPQPPPPAPHAFPTDPPDSPTRTILERLDEFSRWCGTVTQCEEMFLLDDHGDLLWGSPSRGDYLICAKLATTAGMRPQAASLTPSSSTTTVQVAPGKELQLLSCPTVHGNATIALVNAKQVPAALLKNGIAVAMGR